MPPLNSQKEKHSMLSLRRATFKDVGHHCIDAISIHALLAESDAYDVESDKSLNTFLSTLSLRRATLRWPPSGLVRHHFYPRSPCGERPGHKVVIFLLVLISIHALLAESDGMLCRWPGRYCNFYPRSPCGERLGPLVCFWLSANFYPRSPCGERPVYRCGASCRF